MNTVVPVMGVTSIGGVGASGQSPRLASSGNIDAPRHHSPSTPRVRYECDDGHHRERWHPVTPDLHMRLVELETLGLDAVRLDDATISGYWCDRLMAFDGADALDACDMMREWLVQQYCAEVNGRFYEVE